MTISTLTIDPKLLPIDWQTGTTYTILVGSDFVREVGNNRTPSPVRTATISTFAFGPEVSTSTPAYGVLDSTSTTVSLTYNRTVNLTSATSTTNYYLYDSLGTLVSTIPYTSNRISKNQNTVSINLLGLVNSNGVFHLRADANIFGDMFRFPSPAITNDAVFKYSTAKGAEVIAVSPTYNATNSISSSGTLTYNRLASAAANKKYQLFETTGSTTSMVLEIDSTSSRVAITGSNVTIDFTDFIKGNHRYHLRAESGVIKDQFLFDSEAINDDSIFRYTITQPPVPVTVFPVFNSTGSFISTASITFNRSVDLVKNNFYLYNNSGVVRTLSSTGTNVYKVSNTSVAVTLYDEVLPEATYYIGYDLNAVKDTNGIPADASTSTVKWTSKSISDLALLEYNPRISTPVFSGNWYSILDRSPDPDEQYTLTLTATSGTFTSNIGTTVGNTWSYTSTRQNIEAASTNLLFVASIKDLNFDLPLTTTLSRDGVVIATRSNTLIGLFLDLDSMPIVSSSATNSVGSSTVLTVTANTTTAISGDVTFKTASQTFGTSTFVNNTATFTIQPNTVSSGTYSIFGEWQGQSFVPKFNGRNSDTLQQTFVPLAPITLSLSSSPSPYFYHRATGSDFDLFNTATITISGMIYDDHKPTGNIQLLYGNAVIQTQPLPAIPNGTTSTSTTITWQPWQDTTLSNVSRTLRVIYSGDSWNREAAATTPLIAAVKRSPGTITMSPQRTFTYFQDYTITATVSTSNLDGKPITFKVDDITLGTSTVVNNVATINFYATPETYPEGNYTFTGQFVEDFNYFGAIGSMTNLVERLDALFFGQFYPGENRLDPIMIPGFPHIYTTSTVLQSYIVSSLPEFENTTTATVYVDWWIRPVMADGTFERILVGSQPFVGSSSTVVINLSTLPRLANQTSRPDFPTELIYNIEAEIKGIDSQSYELLPPTLTVTQGSTVRGFYNFFRAFFVGL